MAGAEPGCCATCRWWAPDPGLDAADLARYGAPCRRACYVGLDGEAVAPPEPQHAWVVVNQEECAEWSAWLFTLPPFGCVDWEPCDGAG